SKNGVIGRENKLPWHLPEDFKRFKETTYGAPVIMGRKTYESIGRLLPGRKNIIISRDASRLIPGAWVTHSLQEALNEAGPVGEVFILGGGEIYRLALPLADRLYLTEVDVEIDGDAFFPAWPELRQGPIEVEGETIAFKQSQCE
ncbi:dihydrofolate reductase, partial [Paraburkholderia sp. JPY432]|uniref:dihydrofolate reductase n=1 Tax=Paraburkholderia youngii TaxID=2782701 RepID=UPI001595519B